MSVEYTNIHDLSPQNLDQMEREFDQESASVMTVVVRQNGNMAVLSPFAKNWTKHFLIEAGHHLPGVSQN